MKVTPTPAVGHSGSNMSISPPQLQHFTGPQGQPQLGQQPMMLRGGGMLSNDLIANAGVVQPVNNKKGRGI